MRENSYEPPYPQVPVSSSPVGRTRTAKPFQEMAREKSPLTPPLMEIAAETIAQPYESPFDDSIPRR